MLNTKTINKIILAVIFILLLSSSGFSQDSLKEKLDKIKGEIDKITITSGGKDFTFEGKEAEKLFDKMKADHLFVVNEKGNKEKIIIKSDDDSKIYAFGDDDDFLWFGDDDNTGLNKRIKVEMNDGKKKVTVTTKENGEEKTKVYEGDEADEYLDKIKNENNDFDIEFKDGKMKKKIIIESKDLNDN